MHQIGIAPSRVGVGTPLPASVIEAARELVVRHDTVDPDLDGAIEDRLPRTRTGFYAELIRLGWVPPFPVPAEISEVLGDHPAAPDQAGRHGR